MTDTPQTPAASPWQEARGAVPLPPGSELPEETIRRMRDGAGAEEPTGLAAEAARIRQLIGGVPSPGPHPPAPDPSRFVHAACEAAVERQRARADHAEGEAERLRAILKVAQAALDACRDPWSSAPGHSDPECPPPSCPACWRQEEQAREQARSALDAIDAALHREPGR
jgi:hypothetical protein